MITVIGSGPAGISASLYLKRTNKDVMILTTHMSSLKTAHLIENYYGTGKISGEDLYNIGIKSAKELDIPIIEEEVLDINDNSNGFIVTTPNNTYECSAVVLALGSNKKRSTIPGAELFEGKGVSYCATCDGFFFKNKKIAVIGSGNYANHEYEYLKNITNDVTLYNPNDIIEIGGSDKVEHIVLTDNTSTPVDGIFIADTFDGSIIAKKMGLIENEGHIVVDDKMATNIPGVFACGDITGHTKQIATAVHQGMVAANFIIAQEKS